jgi:phosphoribulokinase
MSKIYGGNAKMITTKYGDMWTISQSRKDLETLLKFMNDNDTEWVNSSVKEKQEKVEGKATHYLEVYQREAVQVANKNEGNFKPTEKLIVENDNLPF